jgi:antitoxin YefM
MREISVHEFRSHLREAVEEVTENHVPLRVKCRGGQDFVVVSAEDWEREQETLYVLQNKSLMERIERSRSIKTLLDLSSKARSGSGGRKWTRDELHDR